MARLFTADLHLGHVNIIEYSHRPFADVEDMNVALVEGWNAVVTDDDEVWVLGDLAMGRLEQSLAWVELLQGAIVLVPGNHDSCAAYRKGAKKAEGLYPVSSIVQAPTSLVVGGQNVVVDHFPYKGDSGDQDRYVDQRPVDRGRFLLHGHVHDRWRQRGRMINVGVDAWGGRPVAEGDLAALIRDGENDQEVLPWIID